MIKQLLMLLFAVVAMTVSAASTNNIPENVYLFGNFNGIEDGTFKVDVCIPMERISESIFEVKNLRVGVKLPDRNFGRFIMGTKWGDDYNNDNRFYYVNKADQAQWPNGVKLPATKSVIIRKKGDPSWVFNLGPGTYDIQLDLTNPANPVFRALDASGDAEFENLYMHGVQAISRAETYVRLTKTENGFKCSGVTVDGTTPVYISTHGDNFDPKSSPCYVLENGKLIRATAAAPKFDIPEGTYDITLTTTDDGETPSISWENTVQTALEQPETPTSEAVYYTIDGRKVIPALPGLYIRVQGNVHTKVVIR